MKKKVKAKKLGATWKEVNKSKVKYRKDEKGIVHLSGKVKAGKPVKLPRGLFFRNGTPVPEVMAKPIIDALNKAPSKPTLEQLSLKATDTLAQLRKRIEKDAQTEYEAAKFKEVRRLAEEEGLSEKLIIADITAKEEIKVKS